MTYDCTLSLTFYIQQHELSSRSSISEAHQLIYDISNTINSSTLHSDSSSRNMNSDSTPFGQLSAHQANLQSADRRSLRCGEAARIQNIEPPSISSLLHSTSKWSSPLLLCEPVDFHPAFSKQGLPQHVVAPSPGPTNYQPAPCLSRIG